MEVHKRLGRGFLEIVYKDALEYEFKLQRIPYEREKAYKIPYRDIVLPRTFNADFVVFENIILEVKATSKIIDDFLKQTINYLAAAKSPLGLIVNFGENSLKYKRVVL